MKLKYVKNPKWMNEEKTLIDVVVRLEGIEEELPFTANKNDVEEHGRNIFELCAAGQFGKIQDYTPPTRQQLSFHIKIKRDTLLNSTDWTQLPDVPEETKQKWSVYRQALRDITNQEGYPNTVTWPTEPT